MKKQIFEEQEVNIIYHVTKSGGAYVNLDGHVSYPHDKSAWVELIVVVPGDVTEIKRRNDKRIIKVLAYRNCFSRNGSNFGRGDAVRKDYTDSDFYDIACKTAAKFGLKVPATILN